MKKLPKINGTEIDQCAECQTLLDEKKAIHAYKEGIAYFCRADEGKKSCFLNWLEKQPSARR